jgi:hypothetical protein
MLTGLALASIVLLAESPDVGLEATRHKEQAFRLLAEKKPGPAVRQLELAYQTVPHPDLLLDMAIAYEQWEGHCPQALQQLDRFAAACEGTCSSQALGMTARERLLSSCSVPILLDAVWPDAVLQIGALSLAAPVRTRLLRGRHVIHVLRAGRPTLERTLDVSPHLDRVTFVELGDELIRAQATHEAPLAIDGLAVEPGLAVDLRLGLGPHELRFGGDHPATERLTLLAGETAALRGVDAAPRAEVEATTRAPPAVVAVGRPEGSGRGDPAHLLDRDFAGRPEPGPPPADRDVAGRPWWFWAGAATGVVALAGAGVFAWQTELAVDAGNKASSDPLLLRSVQDSAYRSAALGYASLGVAVIGAGVALIGALKGDSLKGD